MAFYQQQSRITQFVPGYVSRSDFLPTRVIEVSEDDRLQIVRMQLIQLRDIEEDRRAGRVLFQRPAEFNPNRYVSYQVYENVNLAQSIAPEQIQGLVASRRF